jgi:molybdopterin-guanine dinucleotide biosynthesis protein A
MSKKDITGIILAGGKSLRMGKDKARIDLAGKPLISYAIDVLKPVCKSIIISSNSEDYESYGHPVQKDLIPECGPMGGIYSTLLHSSSSLNLVLSCDMPLVSSDLLKYIIDNMDDRKISVPVHGENYLEPLCAGYPFEIIPYLQKFIEKKNLKLHNLIERVPSKQIRIDSRNKFYHPDIFLNINRPGDLEKAGYLLNDK